MEVPRFHGDGRADWDVLVTITYRNWAAMEAHADAEIAARLFPDQARYEAEERRRFELLEAHWDCPLEAAKARARAIDTPTVALAPRRALVGVPSAATIA